MNHEMEQCREVSRQGVVTAVHGAVADVEIVQRSACASCRIKALCAAGESSVKTIHAPNDGTLAPGMSVILSMDERIGWLGVAVGFVVPLVLVVSVLFGLREVVSREEFAGLIAVASLVPYFAFLRRFRGFFSRVVQFRVSRADTPGALHIVRKEGAS